MKTELSHRLAEQWRDALSAYAIHHVLPDKLQAGSLSMMTADHLDRYLMTDTQVSAKVITSGLAEAIACVQTYINAIFSNIEQGYGKDFAPELISFWQQAMSTYSLWAAYQMMEDYPENYIRAELRLDKTELFKTLENDLAQGRIDEAGVQKALLTYLKSYEFLNNIRVQAGYIDYRGEHRDAEQFPGYAHANADYYLLGKDNASPCAYYWRRVKVRLDQASTYIQPDAWSEWKPVSIPPGTTVLQMCPVLFGGRLHVVWLYFTAPTKVLDANNQETDKCSYALTLEIIHLGLDNQWTTPERLCKFDVEVTVPEEGSEYPLPIPEEVAKFRVMAVALGRANGEDDQLFVAVHDTSSKWSEKFHLQRDILKRKTPRDIDADNGITLAKRFQGGAGRLAFSQRIAALDSVVKSITSSGNPHIGLQAVLEQGLEGPMMRVRAYSNELRLRFKTLDLLFESPQWFYNNRIVAYQLKSRDSDGTILLDFTFFSFGAPNFESITIQHEGERLAVLNRSDFKESEFPLIVVATKSFAVPELSRHLSKEYIHEGLGFEVAIDNDPSRPLQSTRNRVNGTVAHVVLPKVELLHQRDGGTSTTVWSGPWSLNKSAVSTWSRLEDILATGSATFEVTAAGETPATFTVTWGANSSLAAATIPYIHQQADGTDFIVFEAIGGNRAPLAVRLNSQHVSDLISRAEASPQAVFAWDAQHRQEPAYRKALVGTTYQGWRPSAEDPLMHMFDAYGGYLRELFFHVPHLIASRLQEEERFADARRWLGLIFNPHQKQPPRETQGPDYWNCAWLLQDDTQAAGLDHELIEPHVIALRAPSHYRKAVFVQFVNMLIGEADQHYRYQTRDSLAHAWLLYRMAADLMGEVPDARAINTWQPKTVREVLAVEATDTHLVGSGQSIVPADLPKQLSTFFWAGVAANPAFRLPVNRQLLDIWQLLAERFYNLRHFLTLDGRPMVLPLYAPPANPFDLLMARMGGGANLSHLMGQRTVVPPYRFRTLIAKAHEVVATLTQFAEQLRGLMEQEERTGLEALQYQHAAEIAGYTIAIQEQLLEQQQQQEAVLLKQALVAEARHTHYTELDSQHMTAGEISGMSLQRSGETINSVGSAAMSAYYSTQVIPRIFGMAADVGDATSPIMSSAQGLFMLGSGLQISGEIVRETSVYSRRREEWRLQATLASKEIEAIAEQGKAQACATQAARNSLDHSRKVLEQAQQMYAFYQSKSTNVSLYRWLRSQVTAWHATLFDVAVGLCNSAEACWQYETGNYDKRIVRASVWQADRHGLNAAGELRLDLHRLEAEALLRNERHLELRKTVSLRALIEQGLVFGKDGAALGDWPALLQTLVENGELDFSLSETLFNQDYPGHYLRRLHSVALSLPALLGPYQNIRATLTQTQSRLLTKADIEGVKYLSPQLDQGGDGHYVMRSLRPSQQVCLSSATQDIGLVTAPESDDRYLPFEGTGAVSDWNLRFPRASRQTDLLQGLSDIVVEVRYLALYGGALFEQQVEALLPEEATGRFASGGRRGHAQPGDDHEQ
ncbi:TPA: neuraminidase-like domain-containing protein [Pseudomonas putida]